MAKDYLLLYIKSLIRHGKEDEALNYLINQKGYWRGDAQFYIRKAKEIIAREPHDD